MLQGTVYSRCFSVFWFASTRLTFQLSCPLRSSPSKWLNAGSAKGPKGRDEKRREMKRKEGTHASLLSPFFSSSLSLFFHLWVVSYLCCWLVSRETTMGGVKREMCLDDLIGLCCRLKPRNPIGHDTALNWLRKETDVGRLASAVTESSTVDLLLMI